MSANGTDRWSWKGIILFLPNEWLGIMVGDIVPIFGIPYQIASVQRVGQSTSTNLQLILRKVKDTRFTSRLATDPYAHVIMNGGRLTGRNNNEIRLQCSEDTETYKLLIDHVSISKNREGHLAYVTKSSTMEAELGTDVTISNGVEDITYRIVKIVPTDPENHIPGWIGIRRRWPEFVPFGVD